MPVTQGKSISTVGAKFVSIPDVEAPDNSHAAASAKVGSEATVTEKASCIPEAAK